MQTPACLWKIQLSSKKNRWSTGCLPLCLWKARTAPTIKSCYLSRVGFTFQFFCPTNCCFVTLWSFLLRLIPLDWHHHCNSSVELIKVTHQKKMAWHTKFVQGKFTTYLPSSSCKMLPWVYATKEQAKAMVPKIQPAEWRSQRLLQTAFSEEKK